MGLEHLGLGEIDVVGGHQGQIKVIGDLHHPRLRARLGLGEPPALARMALKLDVKPPRKGSRQPLGQGARLGRMAAQDQLPQRPQGAPGQGDDPLGVRLKLFQRHLGKLPALVDIKTGVEPHQPHVPRLVLRQQNHGRGRLGLLAWRRHLVGHRDLQPDDRLHPLARGRHRELQRREHGIGVGHGDGRHLHGLGELDQLLDGNRAFQKGVLGMGAQMDESGS